jgi:YidC/Oxa1 family membrane protein insertase
MMHPPEAVAIVQSLLNAIGWLLSRVYDLVANYGATIVLFTVAVRVILLPLNIKQVRSMQASQALQPKIKEIQRKYKGNKTRTQEETMRVYREAGVNPLGGCLPLLLQFPILIAMYSVLRPAPFQPVSEQGQVVAYELKGKVHLPLDSRVFEDVVIHDRDSFLFMDLKCSITQAGTRAPIVDMTRKQVQDGLPLRFENQPVDGFTSHGTDECGTSRFPDAVPYGILLVLMIGSTLYQQRQMQRASPAGAASQQQQTLLRIMPVMFGVFGLWFPAALVLYWTLSNSFQIGQQYLLLRAGHIGPEALERRMAENRARGDAPAKQGFMARMMERAEDAQKQRDQQRREQDRSTQPPRRKPPRSGGSGGGRSSSPPGGRRPKKPKR